LAKNLVSRLGKNLVSSIGLFAHQKPGFCEKPGFLDVSACRSCFRNPVGKKPGFLVDARNQVGKKQKPGFFIDL
jgi:hypothetical protein